MDTDLVLFGRAGRWTIRKRRRRVEDLEFEDAVRFFSPSIFPLHNIYSSTINTIIFISILYFSLSTPRLDFSSFRRDLRLALPLSCPSLDSFITLLHSVITRLFSLSTVGSQQFSSIKKIQIIEIEGRAPLLPRTLPAHLPTPSFPFPLLSSLSPSRCLKKATTTPPILPIDRKATKTTPTPTETATETDSTMKTPRTLQRSPRRQQLLLLPRLRRLQRRS